MMDRMALRWQSRLILLLVLPAAGVDLVLEAGAWSQIDLRAVLVTFGICAAFALIVLLLRAGTPGATFTGFAISSSLIFSTALVVAFPYFSPFRTALTPTIAVFVLAFITTRLGYRGKERVGIAESHSGRSASQIVANLGVAMLFSLHYTQFFLLNSASIGPHLYVPNGYIPGLIFAPALAALAEAAADTVSSEIGQTLSLTFGQRHGTRTRLITTLRHVEPGMDGGITLLGSLAGILAAFIVALAGTWALHGGSLLLILSTSGAIFGLFFDSLLGATLERKGWLNNDAVNFLSTLAAALFTLLLMYLKPQ